MMSQPRLVNRMGAGRWLLLLVLLAGGLGLLRTQGASAVNPSLGTFQFSSATFQATEGTQADIVVTRTGGSGAYCLYYTLYKSSDTAVAGVDYSNTSGCLNFTSDGSVNDNTKHIMITTLHNSVLGDRTLTVRLTPDVNVAFGGPIDATLTIKDIDGPPSFTFDPVAYAASETDVTVPITVRRTGAFNTAVSVQYATANGSAMAGVDYTAKSDTLPFGMNDTTKTFNVTIINRAGTQPTRSFTIALMSPSPAGSLGPAATVFINDIGGAGVLAFSSPAYSVAENAGTILVTVQRSSITGGQTVQYSTSDGTALAGLDYTAAVGQLVFADGDAMKSFPVTIIDNYVVNPSKTFTVTLSSPSLPGMLGSPTSTTVTITDNEVGPPTITRVSPNAGAPAGGNSVTISGTGFATGTVSNVTSVKFGAAVASFIPPVDPNTIIAVAPPGTVGTIVDITVTTAMGTTVNTTADDYSYTNGPIILAVTPPSGPTGVATQVTITGQNFTTLLSVTFGATTAPNCTNPSPTQIICQTPTTIPAGVVDIRVTTSTAVSPISPSDQFTFTGASGTAPTITSISPPSTPVNTSGTVVIITGTNFTAGATVLFGAQAGISPQVVNSTTMTVTAPAWSLSGSVEVVVTSGGQSNLTAGDANNFTYTAGFMPTVTSVSPNTAAVNVAPGTVTITGTNFVVGLTSVTFGGVPGTSVVVNPTTTSLTVTAPTGTIAGTVEVLVTTAVGSNTTVGTQNDFTYTGTVPTITSLTPATGPAGTSVAISGTNFTGVTLVTFGGVSASFIYNSAVGITATAPAGVTPGTAEVVVTTPNGSNTTTGTQNDFIYTSSGATFTYQLFVTWNLIVYTGQNNLDTLNAIKGIETPANAATNDISAQVTAIYRWSPNGVGCTGGQPQCWLGWFPNGVNTPGANDFTTLQNGVAYWIAVTSNVSWTILVGP